MRFYCGLSKQSSATCPGLNSIYGYFFHWSYVGRLTGGVTPGTYSVSIVEILSLLSIFCGRRIIVLHQL